MGIRTVLYKWVGKDWYWKERLSWPEEKWIDCTADENMRMWVAYLQGSIAGYFELNKQDDDLEIRYFGIGPEWIRRLPAD